MRIRQKLLLVFLCIGIVPIVGVGILSFRHTATALRQNALTKLEVVTDLKRGLWVVGTIGSLAPYVGLFGTVVGIIRAFQGMAREGVGGFEVVAAGISEALVATGAGLFVAIVALMFFNYLQTRATALSTVFARSCERFLQSLIFVETAEASGSGQ